MLKNYVGITILVIIMTLVTMLISCHFKYGILVIGSGSMTGSLEVGDAVVFEKYKNQPIEIGQVIIFKRNNLNLVHRVVDIKNTNGEVRYYTKGDFNKQVDFGYITDKNIVGIINFKIRYIGYPTIWLRELFF